MRLKDEKILLSSSFSEILVAGESVHWPFTPFRRMKSPLYILGNLPLRSIHSPEGVNAHCV